MRLAADLMQRHKADFRETGDEKRMLSALLLGELLNILNRLGNDFSGELHFNAHFGAVELPFEQASDGLGFLDFPEPAVQGFKAGAVSLGCGFQSIGDRRRKTASHSR